MKAKIICYFGDMGGEPIARTFTVSYPELSKYQVCYFDRFIPNFENLIKKLESKLTFATLQKITVVVSCHGYNHMYDYKNGKLTPITKE